MINISPLLLVEDDRIDTMSVQRAVTALRLEHPLRVVENGEEALAYLSDTRNALPVAILLDLNTPKMNGIEFLNIVKEDHRLRQIPVIVLTSCAEDRARLTRFGLAPWGYLPKPVVPRQLIEIVRHLSSAHHDNPDQRIAT